MSVSFVGIASAESQSANLVVSKPAGVVQGDILFALILQWNTNPTIPPSGWTYMGGDGLRTTQCYLRAGASEPSSYTLATGVTSLRTLGLIAAYRGNRRNFSEPLIDGGIWWVDNTFNFGAHNLSFAHAISQGTQQRDGMGYMAGLMFTTLGVGGTVSDTSWPPSSMTQRAALLTSDSHSFLGWADRLASVVPPITNYTPPDVSFSNSGGSGWQACSSTQWLNREQNKQGGTII